MADRDNGAAPSRTTKRAVKAKTKAAPSAVGAQNFPEVPQRPRGSSERGRPGPPLKQDFPTPPPHLRPETASWWQAVVDEYELEPHHHRLLRLACEAWDSGQSARESIALHSAVYVDRFGQPRARPEVAIERDARIAFARLMRELALDVEGPADSGRPPQIFGKSNLRSEEFEIGEAGNLFH